MVQERRYGAEATQVTITPVRPGRAPKILGDLGWMLRLERTP